MLVNCLRVFFLKILSVLFYISVNAQTQFYFQDFETTNDWTLSPAGFTNGHNYWVWGDGTTGATTGFATYSGTKSLQILRRHGGGWNQDYFSNQQFWS